MILQSSQLVNLLDLFCLDLLHLNIDFFQFVFAQGFLLTQLDQFFHINASLQSGFFLHFFVLFLVISLQFFNGSCVLDLELLKLRILAYMKLFKLLPLLIATFQFLQIKLLLLSLFLLHKGTDTFPILVRFFLFQLSQFYLLFKFSLLL